MLVFHLCNAMSGKGVILCIEKALEDAGVTKEDINYINAHATSTLMGDLKEFEALNHCFGQNPQAISYFQIYSLFSSKSSLCAFET
jgi:3-oxoacyl-(acyl-carrier-protein) synthase